MKYFKTVLLGLCLGTALFSQAQVPTKPLAWEDVIGWKRITAQTISDNGKWVACQMEPWRGDASVTLYNDLGAEKASFASAEGASFSASSNFMLVTLKPSVAVVDSLKLKKTKEDKMPMNKLVIYHLVSDKKEVIDSVRTFKLSESADWIAYQRGSKADSALYVRSLDGSKMDSLPAVTDFGFAKKSNVLYFVKSESDKNDKEALVSLHTLVPEKGKSLLFEGKGVLKKMAFDENGSKLAFLYCAHKDSTFKGYSLYVSEKMEKARLIADKKNNAFPAGWVLSENESLQFSRNSSRLFFGTSPEPKQKDTTVLAENRPNVHIWNWDEDTQYTQQDYDRAKDLKKTYTAVYNFASKQVFQLATADIPDLKLADEGNASWALLYSTKAYDTERMWTGDSRVDMYRVNLDTGVRDVIKSGVNATMQLSPKGSFAYWYNAPDSSWYTYDMAARKEYRLTTPENFTAWDEDNDVPDYPAAHGVAGWTTDDKQVLIYDRYDIWQFDPRATKEPVNLTVNGRKEMITYRLVKLDKEERDISLNKRQILIGFNEKSKGYGYYRAQFSKAAVPSVLMAGNYMLKSPLKAKKSDAVLYTVETFQQYPDLHLSDLDFAKGIKLTNGVAQQEGFNWGTAELVHWISLDGRPLEGVVYKPADFDPAKKYPMIVNFYERNAETLYGYRMPEPHRSTIDYHYYTSNGYLVFNPDVRYKDGYPGESCYNSIMPGISALIAQGYVDEKAIGAQGHSWGGYQVAYLATRTNLFAAIESGAPVVNMFSAYGGIRWGTGLNRSFQYEHGQSRIGGTPWQKPLNYMENSPLFTMDKVQTPILIMHNDNDGHVPWYQGIEYFVALKRLQKPAWLLNYTGEVHWPMRMANRIDFQKRMFQFFDHYLRNQPMPDWMKEGVPAVERDFELGY